MFDESYFNSLSIELRALKNRVRNFIQAHHWQTDGEWKESVLRTFLRRHLPKSIEIGRGFVITDDAPSKQIDVLIYDSTKPILFQDGDLVFITPDAVHGVIEVKTSLDNTKFRTAVETLCSNSDLILSKSPGSKVFGLFSYEDETTDIDTTLRTIKEVVHGEWKRIVHCICIGEANFIRYWNIDPVTGKRPLNKWHAYKLQEKAPGYFLHNVIEEICPQSVSEDF
ncbi:MAG: hypothetical protein HYV59_02095 [Planctomycetes bacterium]|nr:hypothetical protein [Planctomycetota bacterium]